MEEKIKIYISEKVLRILDKDAELFEFYKKNGGINRNAFLNTLILHYDDLFRQKQQKRTEHTEKLLREHGCPDRELAVLLSRVPEADKTEAGKLNTVISLKPTRASADLIRFIQFAPQDSTASGYFRQMFSSYVSMPRDEREKIIFKDQYELIRKAIREGREISFVRTGRLQKVYTVSPYLIASAKEELFNYVLCSLDGSPATFRLSRIAKVIFTGRPSLISSETEHFLKETAEKGPQFVITEDQDICVRLSRRGQSLFRSMYLHRPVPEEVRDDLYYFRCSENQILQYFSRFGKDAVILSPAALKEKMKRYYKEGLQAYETDSI